MIALEKKLKTLFEKLKQDPELEQYGGMDGITEELLMKIIHQEMKEDQAIKTLAEYYSKKDK